MVTMRRQAYYAAAATARSLGIILCRNVKIGMLRFLVPTYSVLVVVQHIKRGSERGTCCVVQFTVEVPGVEWLSFQSLGHGCEEYR